jgi:hypothetical protein
MRRDKVLSRLARLTLRQILPLRLEGRLGSAHQGCALVRQSLRHDAHGWLTSGTRSGRLDRVRLASGHTAESRRRISHLNQTHRRRIKGFSVLGVALVRVRF